MTKNRTVTSLTVSPLGANAYTTSGAAAPRGSRRLSFTTTEGVGRRTLVIDEMPVTGDEMSRHATASQAAPITVIAPSERLLTAAAARARPLASRRPGTPHR